MLSTVNSSKCNRYYVIESSSHKNLISQIFFKFILSLTIVTSGGSLYLFSRCRSKQRQTQLCYQKISLSLPVVGNSIPIYLFLSTLFNPTLCASTLSTQLSNQNLSITPKEGISTLDVPLLGNAVPLRRQVTSGHCSTRLLPKNYLTVHTRVIRPKCTCEYSIPDRPSFLCLASTSP